MNDCVCGIYGLIFKNESYIKQNSNILEIKVARDGIEWSQYDYLIDHEKGRLTFREAFIYWSL